jgi:hypothetical protein
LPANSSDDTSSDPKFIQITFDDGKVTGKEETICAIYSCWHKSTKLHFNQVGLWLEDGTAPLMKLMMMIAPFVAMSNSRQQKDFVVSVLKVPKVYFYVMCRGVLSKY